MWACGTRALDLSSSVAVRKLHFEMCRVCFGWIRISYVRRARFFRSNIIYSVHGALDGVSARLRVPQANVDGIADGCGSVRRVLLRRGVVSENGASDREWRRGLPGLPVSP